LENQAMADDPLFNYVMSAYPKQVDLAGGGTITLRALFVPQDRAEVGHFFERVPIEDRAFLKENLLDREEVETWLDGVDPSRETVIVAMLDGRIVGTAVLERQRGWSRHVGEVRVVVEPVVRHRGLGDVLARTIFDLAQKAGLEKIVAEMVLDEPGSIRVFKRLGFRTEAVLNDQVVDRHEHKHDLLVMAYYVRPSP
jgi:putative acetyltransferase